MNGYKKLTSHPNYSVSRGGRVINNRNNRILKPNTKSGYEVVHLDGKNVGVHRLVAEAWLNNGKPLTSDLHVHHNNNIKTDNRISNLRIVSRKRHQQLHQIQHEYLTWVVTTKRYKEFEETRLAELETQG